jgi:hypothetical protein
MKTIHLRYDAARKVWFDPSSGISLCHWLDTNPDDPDGPLVPSEEIRKRTMASAEKMFRDRLKLDENTSLRVVFDEHTYTSDRTDVPVEVKLTNFNKAAASA